MSDMLPGWRPCPNPECCAGEVLVSGDPRGDNYRTAECQTCHGLAGIRLDDPVAAVRRAS